jgi:pyoverdine/dityrosine biosynthesis protein Dit1
LDINFTQAVLSIMQFARRPTDAPSGLALDDENFFHASHTNMEVAETSNKILDIILEHALNKFNDPVERLTAGRPKFLSVIEQFVIEGTQVKMCLPAFPFKSANKVYKVFGILPDKAEELSFERLNAMCAQIERLYSPGAKLTIISDGLVYNGLSSTS